MTQPNEIDAYFAAMAEAEHRFHAPHAHIATCEGGERVTIRLTHPGPREAAIRFAREQLKRLGGDPANVTSFS